MGDESYRGLFNLEKAAILIADGDLMGRSILSQIVSGLGARDIVRAENIAEAQRVLSSTAFDLILFDPATLGEEGHDLAAWIRRTLPAPARFTPIILVTGHTQQSRVSAARDGGANFVISKPVSPVTVFERITWLARDKRPFVSCNVYVGPDRRWKDDGPPDENNGRRENDPASAEPPGAGDEPRSQERPVVNEGLVMNPGRGEL